MRIEIPKPFAGHLRIGTCSWKYDTWKGLYYDPARKYRADDYLPDYAKHLDSVEVDQWFWSLFPAGVRLPETRTVETYAASVPDDFTFTVKAPNALTLTHYYAKQPAGYTEYAGKPNEDFLSIELLDRFLDRVFLLGRKLGPIMFQFEYLNRKKMPSKETFIEKFGEFLDRAPKGFEYALEIRNPRTTASFAFTGAIASRSKRPPRRSGTASSHPSRRGSRRRSRSFAKTRAGGRARS